MKKIIGLLILIFLNCYNPPKLIKGAFYSVLDSGGYLPVQVVDIEGEIVFLMYHENVFKNRPNESDLVNLKNIYYEGKKAGEKLIVITPTTISDFYTWKPKYIAEKEIDSSIIPIVAFLKKEKIIIQNNRQETIKQANTKDEENNGNGNK